MSQPEKDTSVYPYLMPQAWQGYMYKEQSKAFRAAQENPAVDQMFDHLKDFSRAFRNFNGTLVEWGQKMADLDMSQLSDKAKRSMVEALRLRPTVREADQTQTDNFKNTCDAMIGVIQDRPGARQSLKNASQSYLDISANRKANLARLVTKFTEIGPGAHNDGRVADCLEKMSKFSREEMYEQRWKLGGHAEKLLQKRPESDTKTPLQKQGVVMLGSVMTYAKEEVALKPLTDSLGAMSQQWKRVRDEQQPNMSSKAPSTAPSMRK